MKEIFINKKTVRNGTYSLGVTILVIGIVVAANFVLSQLPANIKSMDMSSNSIYSIGETTEEVVKALETDVEILVIAEEDSVDERIKRLLNTYSDLSKHIKVSNIDPVQYPSALTEYNTTEDSLVVLCKETDKQTSIPFDQIIVIDTMSYYYYGQYTELEFDGEGQVTSAIDYVTNENSKKVYTLSGHDESPLSGSVQDLIKKANMTVSSVNILTMGSIPKDCDVLLINSPVKDLADDELAIIQKYVEGGGNLYCLLGNNAKTLPNMEKLVNGYGLEIQPGHVADRERYYQNNNYNIFPEMDEENEITADLGQDDLSLVTGAIGMTVSENLQDNLVVEPFMTTSAKGVVVDGESQTDGRYILATTVTFGDSDGKVILISAGSIINEQITSSFGNLSNLDVFMNGLAWYFDDVSNISIPAKSLEVAQNTISNGGVWGVLFIVIIPLGILIAGFIIWRKRRLA